MKLESSYAELSDTLVCPTGLLERGDLIRYEKYGKEMTAWFWGPDKGRVVVRKTVNTFDSVSVESVLELVEKKDLQEELGEEL